MEKRPFTAFVRVDKDNVNSVTITTEPPIEGRSLADMVDWLGNVRSDLASGEYAISVGAPEDGVTGTGPDKRTTDILRRKLQEPLTDLQEEVTAAYAWNGLDDDAFVAQVAGNLGTQIADNLGSVKPEDLKPGFMQFTAGCPHCGPVTSVLSSRLGDLAERDLPEEEKPLRESLIGFVTNILGIAPKKLKGAVVAFVPGAPHGNAFEAPANARLQARLDRLASKIELEVAGTLVERAAASRGRAEEYASALRVNFNLT